MLSFPCYLISCAKLFRNFLSASETLESGVFFPCGGPWGYTPPPTCRFELNDCYLHHAAATTTIGSARSVLCGGGHKGGTHNILEIWGCLLRDYVFSSVLTDRQGVPPLMDPTWKNSPDSSVSEADKKSLKILAQEIKQQGNDSISKTPSKNQQISDTILLIQGSSFTAGIMYVNATVSYCRGDPCSIQ